MAKPSLPQGMRDFSADVIRKRSFILNTIKSVFELYAFEPLETPAMENLETLTGKYGDEGDKLIYKIRSNKNVFNTYPEIADKLKDLLKNVSDYDYTFLAHKSDKALRYDLTIPFARHVAMNHTRLVYPFRRYQIQPVWRGDRPQKGRYREFTQCDADVVGSKALLNEVELANIYHEAFTKLGIKGYELRVNSRKILAALAQICNAEDQLVNITVAIDKLDKIGIEKVKEELAERNLAAPQITVIEKYLSITGTNEEKIIALKEIFAGNELAKAGIEELEIVQSKTFTEANLIFDFTLARGLNYYTGIIFEAKAPASVSIGSIGGGGRYDDLTGLFDVPGIPGVGISFGIDRIYDVMEELNIFPEDLQTGSTAIFFNMGEQESSFAFGIMQQLRSKGISCELYHEAVKIGKQFAYAEKKNIPYAIIIGSKEMEQNICLVKNLTTTEQQTITLAELPSFFKK